MSDTTARPQQDGEPTGIDRALVVLASVVVLGTVMSILDTTIVNVALDTLGRDLHATLTSVQWVATGYLLSLSLVIPLTGWAIDRFGTRRLYIVSVALFLAGSAACGAAWSMNSLILFRVLQGIGGGMIMPVGQTILAQAAGPSRMGRVMSIIGVPMMLGPVLGPVLGGVLVQDVSWRWIFYVNLPVGAVALVLASRILPAASSLREHRLDTLGLALLSPGLALLVYGLSAASSAGGFGGTTTLVGVSVGVVLIAAFIFHAYRKGDAALIDVRLFADRAFGSGAATTFLFGIGLFGAMILLPLYYQVVRGEGALAAGLLVAPQGIGMAVAMPTAGQLTDRIGAGRVVPVGLAVTLLGSIAYCFVGAHTSYLLLAGALFVRGLGMGATMMPASAASYAALDRAAVPRATTSLNIVQRVGGSIGTALLAVILQRQLLAALPGHVSGGALGAAASVPPAVLARLAPSMASAFASTFWWAFFLIAAAYLPALILPKRAVSASPASVTATPVEV